MSRPGLISVRAELVKDVLVGRIAERARERAGDQRDPARLGYEMRIVEGELFDPARQAAGWLTEELRRRTEDGADPRAAIEALGRELAAAEPEGRPAPDDEQASSWRVPGPGGHVRHYVAEQLAPAEKRSFMYGFFLRCCEEALEGAGPAPTS